MLNDLNAVKGPIFRILRVLEYVGPRSWLDAALQRRSVKGEIVMDNGCQIREAIVGEVPLIFSSEELPLLRPAHVVGVAQQSTAPGKPTIQEWCDNELVGLKMKADDGHITMTQFYLLEAQLKSFVEFCNQE